MAATEGKNLKELIQGIVNAANHVASQAQKVLDADTPATAFEEFDWISSGITDIEEYRDAAENQEGVDYDNETVTLEDE